jgi:hypothetical protein
VWLLSDRPTWRGDEDVAGDDRIEAAILALTTTRAGTRVFGGDSRTDPSVSFTVRASPAASR